MFRVDAHEKKYFLIVVEPLRVGYPNNFFFTIFTFFLSPGNGLKWIKNG